jgi:hypothetical protein
MMYAGLPSPSVAVHVMLKYVFIVVSCCCQFRSTAFSRPSVQTLFTPPPVVGTHDAVSIITIGSL